MVKVVLYVQFMPTLISMQIQVIINLIFRFSLIIVEEVVVLRVSNRGLAQNTQANNKWGTRNLSTTG